MKWAFDKLKLLSIVTISSAVFIAVLVIVICLIDEYCERNEKRKRNRSKNVVKKVFQGFAGLMGG